MKNIWKRFFSLTEGQDFYIRRNKLAVKVGFCLYREHEALVGGPGWFVRIAPWRRVRTTQPVKGVNRIVKGTETGRLVTNHNIQSAYWPRAKDCMDLGDHRDINPGKTHYVGDDCLGGHRDTAAEQIQVNAGCAIIHEVARELTASKTQAPAPSTAVACPIALAVARVACPISPAVARELAASEIQDRENLDKVLAQANAQSCECEIYQACARCSPHDAKPERDPMAQDHSPDKPSGTERNGPSS